MVILQHTGGIFDSFEIKASLAGQNLNHMSVTIFLILIN